MPLDGKIVLIESADPGFDWIFLRGITGLITCYGGANSHMAVRSKELNIPAAIGVGAATFESLKKSNVIFLDCVNKRIESH
jgi:phosphoenolpyruvate-protein kinase (PTS system EI component)